TRPPYAPTEGPFALRLLDDGNVAFVDWATPPSAGPFWTPEAMLEKFLGATRYDRDTEAHVYALAGWISEGAQEPKCLLVSSPDPLFGCSLASWIAPTDTQPNVYTGTDYSLTPPPQSIRVQNNAYDLFAPDPARAGSPSSPIPRFATFLVRPILPKPEGCFGCTDVVFE